MKLSEKQQQVIDLMQDGWQLGMDNFNNGRTWLQKNGIGHGGDCIDVRRNTVESLEKKGLIKAKWGFPTSIFSLAQ
jgi:hypothetical protein